MSIHGKWVCSCGALIAQCRCIEGEKEEVRVIRGGCDECRRKKAQARLVGAQMVQGFQAGLRVVPAWLLEMGFETKGGAAK